MKFNRNLSIALICVLLGVMISWQYKSIYNNSQDESKKVVRLEELKDQLLLEKNNNENLRKRNEELNKLNTEYENAKGNIDLYEKNLRSELERARIIAGLTEVKGKGVVITLDNGEFTFVRDEDILSLLNELKASDAQAISINEERITAMSEVREGGGYTIINNKQMKTPFVIKAIAEPQKLENSLKMIGSVVDNLRELYYLKVAIDKKDNIIIPKVRDDGSVIRTDLLIPVNK